MQKGIQIIYCLSFPSFRWDLASGELSMEAKVFKTNPNSRDMKGWSCACIAVFHNALNTLPLLLANGADPSLRSSYNKNAWDLAKDELDAAGKVVKSNEEIRNILIEFENQVSSKKTVFGNGNEGINRDVNMYADLEHNGSPVVMQLEMEKEGKSKEKKGTGTGKKSSNSTSTSSSSSGTKKKKANTKK
jgi:hypothetical protein